MRLWVTHHMEAFPFVFLEWPECHCRTPPQIDTSGLSLSVPPTVKLLITLSLRRNPGFMWCFFYLTCFCLGWYSQDSRYPALRRSFCHCVLFVGRKGSCLTYGSCTNMYVKEAATHSWLRLGSRWYSLSFSLVPSEMCTTHQSSAKKWSNSSWFGTSTIKMKWNVYVWHEV